MKLRTILCLLALCSVSVSSMAAQEAQRTLTNADIINLAKSQVGEQTIILLIQKAPTKFDTSPEAIIDLKKAGVTDAVLNTMLGALPTAAATAVNSPPDCSGLLDRVLASVGAREKLLSVHSVRWSGKEIINAASGTSSVNIERVRVFPSNIYFSWQQSNGQISKAVFTPDFNYLTTAKMTTGIPAPNLQQLQFEMKLEPIYISQHRDQYSCILQGTEQIGNVPTSKLNVRGQDVDGSWNIDPASGRLLRTTFTTSGSNQSATDFSDWRQVDGIYVPFAGHVTRHDIKGNLTTDLTINEYQVNPVTDGNLFKPPADLRAADLTFKVLQSESTPYVVQTNGGISTACNISGSTNTSISSSTYGNTTYGTATSTPSLQMNCRSSDTTVRWTHVLNAMFVEASDGVDYIIACDRAWRWSKCTPLKAGDTFIARRTDKGFVVQSFNAKSKEQEETYSVLQSRTVHE